MKQSISLVTLPVSDLAVSRDFYGRILGWKAAAEMEHVSFYQMNGLVFGLITRELLAEDMGQPCEAGRNPFTLAHNVASVEEVDEIFHHLREAGVTITKEPQKTFWGGYSGYFSDPDGHCWEVAHNPFWDISPEGFVTMPGGN